MVLRRVCDRESKEMVERYGDVMGRLKRHGCGIVAQKQAQARTPILE